MIYIVLYIKGFLFADSAKLKPKITEGKNKIEQMFYKARFQFAIWQPLHWIHRSGVYPYPVVAYCYFTELQFLPTLTGYCPFAIHIVVHNSSKAASERPDNVDHQTNIFILDSGTKYRLNDCLHISNHWPTWQSIMKGLSRYSMEIKSLLLDISFCFICSKVIFTRYKDVSVRFFHLFLTPAINRKKFVFAL